MEDNENCDNCSDHASTVKALADGQTYVAPCPRSAQALREDLKQVYPDQEPEVVVHGTEEHVSCLIQRFHLLIVVDPKSKKTA